MKTKVFKRYTDKINMKKAIALGLVLIVPGGIPMAIGYYLYKRFKR